MDDFVNIGGHFGLLKLGLGHGFLIFFYADNV